MAIDAPAAQADTGRRVLVTLGVLFLYRLGCCIPLPGLDPDVYRAMQAETGAPLARLSIFALGVVPIFTALIVLEIAKLACPALARWQASDRRRAQWIRRATLAAALAIAALQGLGVAIGLEGVHDVVADPEQTFTLEVVATLVGATAALAWLGEQMTRRGLGDGFWILLVAPALARLPQTAATLGELQRQGWVSPGQVFAVGAYFVLAIAIVVALAKAREGSNARASSPGLGSGVARAEAAGPIDVWPPLLANSVGRVLLILVSLGLGHAIDLSFLAVGAPAHILFTGALIAGFAWLRRPAGDAGAGAPPVRLTALAQIAICCGGEALTAGLGVPFALDGAWLIVIVATAMRVAGAARPL